MIQAALRFAAVEWVLARLDDGRERVRMIQHVRALLGPQAAEDLAGILDAASKAPPAAARRMIDDVLRARKIPASGPRRSTPPDFPRGCL